MDGTVNFRVPAPRCHLGAPAFKGINMFGSLFSESASKSRKCKVEDGFKVSHTIHVWNMYLHLDHLVDFYGKCG